MMFGICLCHQRNVRRCRLHSWSVHRSVELRELESEASSLFAIEPGLLDFVRMISVNPLLFGLILRSAR